MGGRNRLRRNRWLIGLSQRGFAAAIALGLASSVAGAAQTVPHEAHYRVKLGVLKIPGEVKWSDGDMAVQVTRDCQKWTVQQETWFEVRFADGREFDIRSRYRFHEALDGKRFEFTVVTQVNGQTTLDTKGIAILPENEDGDGLAMFSKPEAAELELPAGVGFPVTVANRSLEMLASGAPFSRYLIFDGTGLYNVTDIVVGQPIPLKVRPEGDIELLRSRAWRVKSTMFPYKAGDTGPASEVITQTLENGIVDRFVIDYGALTAEGVLSSILRLSDPEC